MYNFMTNKGTMPKKEDIFEAVLHFNTKDSKKTFYW